MKLLKQTSISFLLLSVLTIATASKPTDEEPCVQELRACLTKMAQQSSPKGNQAYYMHMGIIKKMAPGSETPDTDADVKLIISAHQMHYETQLLSVYKDDQDALTIVHPSKQIIRSKGSKIPYNDQALTGVSKLQLDMLSKCTATGCKLLDKDGVKLKQVILFPNESLKKSAQVKTMTFTYDPKAQDLKTIETRYLPGQPMINEKVSIYNTDFNYKEALPASVLNKVYNSSGKLLSKYKGYKVVDQR
ncbi:MAG: hypothetical protein JWO58_451 [Chitinophagaceae bacterium]|nr:hypothetical protein [Chitinophagaceae bacterium]